ncbi:DUF2255 family protein [Oecophyllibacter saccharovorans]|uniref:DUF2255 family protein n=1 Tax=Oecophyllibacter saccharovorans TaxID=2558360 RepID=A0A506UM73_9PROT|nr:DUF2255 family protein [Oecophyllibacter saccharovorans]TPW34441.1 DUF2255 family protein [Oecophyllibacter saccharovorans]
MRWNPGELKQIVEADDLKVAPLREDGVHYGTPTWIWCVDVEGALYVRPYNGTQSRWYQAALCEGRGRITAAGRTREVRFEPAEASLAGRIDDAYRAKYQGSPYLAPMLGERVREAGVKIVPA